MEQPGRRGRKPSRIHGRQAYTAGFSEREQRMATVELTRDNFETVVNDNPIVIVDFWAPWCGPCRGFAPVFEQASESHADVVFAKVNTDEEQEIAQAFNIRSIPTLMVFRENVVLYQEAGALPAATLEQVVTQAK